MDNKVIIDGVDVSKCEFYINSKNLEYNCKQTPQSYFCKNNPDCYYKQLKTKEQECEELKKDNSTLKDILSYPKYTNENAYNELLKLSKAELIKNLIESHQHGESITQVVYRSISEENTKYKQTLAEIKDLLLKTPTDSQKHCVNAKGAILLRIREVIPNEN